MANTIQNKVATTNTAVEKKTMQSYIKAMEGEIKKALPSVITPERFTRMVLSAISVNPKLGSCTPQSFLGAMMSAAQLGLEPRIQATVLVTWLFKSELCLERPQFQLTHNITVLYMIP